jgi:integrase
MAKVTVHAGLSMRIRHLLVQDGRCYYQRRVPVDLRARYKSSNIKIPLGDDPLKAGKKVAQVAAAHDSLWAAMRGDPSLSSVELHAAARQMLLDAGLEEGIGLEHPVVGDFLDDLIERQRDSGLSPLDRVAHQALKKKLPMLLSEGLALYLDNHKHGKDTKLVTQAKRDWDALIAVTGDIPIRSFTREHAKQVRDTLLTQMKTTSVQRRMNTQRAIFTSIRRETGDERPNPFEALQIAGLGADSKRRTPFQGDELRMIVRRCRQQDDERRRLVLMLLYTGMRLSEPMGLIADDLKLDDEVPYINLRVHPWRSLKTLNSARLIPLVGVALDLAMTLKASASADGFLFPTYASLDSVKGDAASATLNKWLLGVIGKRKTCHGFRHTMRDLLRNVGTPADVANEIGGWSKRSIGDNYGHGYALEIKARYLSAAYESFAG